MRGGGEREGGPRRVALDPTVPVLGGPLGRVAHLGGPREAVQHVLRDFAGRGDRVEAVHLRRRRSRRAPSSRTSPSERAREEKEEKEEEEEELRDWHPPSRRRRTRRRRSPRTRSPRGAARAGGPWSRGDRARCGGGTKRELRRNTPTRRRAPREVVCGSSRGTRSFVPRVHTHTRTRTVRV